MGQFLKKVTLLFVMFFDFPEEDLEFFNNSTASDIDIWEKQHSLLKIRTLAELSKNNNHDNDYNAIRIRKKMAKEDGAFYFS